MEKAFELLFSYSPGLFAFMVVATWAIFMLVGWRGEKRSFGGLLSKFSNDCGREYGWTINDVYIAPDKKLLEEYRNTWTKRIERVRNDDVNLLTVAFGKNCEYMSDEFSEMWVLFAKDVLANKGLVLKLILPLIEPYSKLTEKLKHMVAEYARDGNESIPIILAIGEHTKLHELKSLDELVAKKQ